MSSSWIHLSNHEVEAAFSDDHPLADTLRRLGLPDDLAQGLLSHAGLADAAGSEQTYIALPPQRQRRALHHFKMLRGSPADPLEDDFPAADPEVALKDWLEHGLVLLDVRSRADFEQTRIATPPLPEDSDSRAIVASLPWPQLPTRTFELPPRERALVLLTTSELAPAQARFLRHTRSLHNNTRRDAWVVRHVLCADDTLWAAAAALGLLSTAPLPRQHLCPRMWAPCPLLEDGRLLTRLRSLPPPWGAVDLGAGSGRDAVYLAEILGAAVSVTAVDHLLASRSRTAALAEARRQEVRWAQLDLRGDPEEVVRALGELAGPPCMLVVGVRFLHRPLLPALREAVAPGGVVAWAHFQRPAGVPWAFEHPSKAEDILEGGELVECFDGWEVLIDDACTLPDGRPFVTFAAQKPLSES